MIIYNGIDLSDLIKVKSIMGRGIANTEVILLDNQKSDGARFKRKRRPPRQINIDVDIKGNGYEEIRDNIEIINGILNVKEPVPIIFKDEPDRVYYGIASMVTESLENIVKNNSAITIICPDPDKLGEEKTLLITTTKQTFNVSGQKETHWKSTTVINSDTNRFELVNEGLGKIVLNFNFIDGDVIEIDSKMRKVLVNGEIKQTTINIVETEWFMLNKGNNILVASHNTVIKYNERFL